MATVMSTVCMLMCFSKPIDPEFLDSLIPVDSIESRHIYETIAPLSAGDELKHY